MEDLIITDKKIRNMLDEVSELTSMNYSDYSIDSLVNAVEDLLNECKCLQDEIEEINQNIEDNYKPLRKEEEIGYDERDFM